MRMPKLSRYPTRAFGGKFKVGNMFGFTRKNAAAGCETLIERFDGDFRSFFINSSNGVDTVKRKPPQTIAHMTPGIEVTVVVLMNEALGRDFSQRDLVTGASVALDFARCARTKTN
jgi:hypothetical protein